MAVLADVLSWACLMAGSAFTIVGAIGMVRLPDVFTRMHGAGIIDTLGIGLIFLGLMIQGGPTLVTIKLVLVLLFVLITTPTATHALARATLDAGVEPLTGDGDGDGDEGDVPSKT